MDTHTLIRLVVGLGMTAVVLVFAARRVLWLTNLIRSGQKTSDEHGRKDDLGTRIRTQITEVFGQTRLLKWSIPGLAHFFTMWGFFILATVYLEAYGLLFVHDFHIPFVGRWDGLGFLQDFIALSVLAGITTFAIIRLRTEPKEHGRESRFYGSHTGGAWLILFMIFNVIWTYALVRGSAVNTNNLPYGNGAFFSQFMGWVLRPLGHTANEWIETIALLLHIAVMLVFLLIVLHSKHLHIGLAPLNVTFKRLPNALGPLLPVEFKGEPIDFEDPAEDAVLGRGKIEDFTWKGYLDFTTCTECGRCQSQCPAWNTGKPLSPKLVIMNLRDHLFAKAPYILGDKETPLENTPEGGLGEDLGGEKHDEEHHVPESGFERVMGSGPEQATRPLVGTAEQLGVIDPDVLWSCTTCGACVEQCPVDIEHIDHIVDMRRYQVMMESEFPGELGVLFKNLEAKGNPWGQNAKDRTNWIDEVEFDVPVFGKDVDSFEGYEYLFWVGCAGAYEDRAKKTTKAVAELLAAAGVKYLVLGEGETCNGDSARRSGNEFLFQQLAAQNVETLNDLFEGVERVDRKVVVTCPHCFNTLGREYPQVGGNYTVLHHTQLLNRLLRDKKLVPVKPVDGEGSDITYHDPCYLGRHNKVYDAPRELIGASGAKLTEMPRHADRGLCCGAGGARMWMEEHIGKRVNHERVEEALDTGASKIATGCPFCRVMMTDGVDDVAAANDLPKAEVLDVAQLLAWLARHELGHAARKGHRCKGSRGARRQEGRSRPGQGGSRDRRGGAGSRTGTEGGRSDRGGIQAGDRTGYRGRCEASRCEEDSSRRGQAGRKAGGGSSACKGSGPGRGSQATRGQEDGRRTRRGEGGGTRRGRDRGAGQSRTRGEGSGPGRGRTPPRREEGTGRRTRRGEGGGSCRRARRSAGRGPRQARTGGQGSRHRRGRPPPGREKGTCDTRSQTRCGAAGTGGRRRIRSCA